VGGSTGRAWDSRSIPAWTLLRSNLWHAVNTLCRAVPLNAGVKTGNVTGGYVRGVVYHP